MFKDSIPGLDEIFETDVKRPKTILVTGPPGSMKTTFVHMLMSKYLAKKDEFGLYTTLEESVRSHLRTIKSIGMEISLNMQISDFSELRKSQGDNIDKIDYLGFELNRDLQLATEDDIADLFDDCERGAVPPLGPAYGIETLLDVSLTGVADVFFEAGDHELLVHLRGDRFQTLLGDARRGYYSRTPGTCNDFCASSRF